MNRQRDFREFGLADKFIAVAAIFAYTTYVDPSTVVEPEQPEDRMDIYDIKIATGPLYIGMVFAIVVLCSERLINKFVYKNDNPSYNNIYVLVNLDQNYQNNSLSSYSYNANSRRKNKRHLLFVTKFQKHLDTVY